MTYINVSEHTKPTKTVINGFTVYTQNGHLHREDGPAVESEWSKEWFIGGIPHRDNGPAKMYKQHPMPVGREAIAANGKNICEWYFEGKHIQSAIIDQPTFDTHWSSK